MKAGLALLLLAEGPALAETASQKLLVRLRAVVQQYDKIAFRPPASLAADTVELRGKFRELLVEASALAPESQPFREMAEIFVFSGGDSAALRPFEKGLEPGSTEAKLFEGVMAYAEGRKAEAGTKLAAIDATRLNPMRAGHLSLALGILLAPSDPARAFGYFQDAAVFLPGTLVEEAALRQSAVLAAKIGDPDKFAAATVTYLRRFPHSSYIEGAEKNLVPDVVQFPERQALRVSSDRLERHPGGMGPLSGLCSRGHCGPGALVWKAGAGIHGRHRNGLPYAPAGSERQQRLLLYSGAAAIVTNRFEEGLMSLHEIKPELLGQDDGQLLQVSLALALKLQEMPVVLNSSKQDRL